MATKRKAAKSAGKKKAARKHVGKKAGKKKAARKKVSRAGASVIRTPQKN
jgi:hypothetical protein